MSVEVTTRGTLQSRNPATLEVLGEVKIPAREEILQVVSAARVAFTSWRQLSLKQRLAYIERFRRTVMENREELARLITCETGKPLLESFGTELFGPLESCSWLQRNAPRLLAPQSVKLNPVFFLGKRSYNVCEPLGVIAIISPWNYAFCIPVCSMLTALAAGNTVVLKPSPKTPLVGEAIGELFRKAGFPDGVVSVVAGDREEAKTLVLSDVDRVVFTGSVGGGRAIMGLAAQRLHPVTLELGGKHPAIVLDDVDVDRVAQAIVWGAFTNAGQACVSIERLYALRPIAARLAERVAWHTSQLKLGNGLSADTDVGPVIDQEQVDRIQALVKQALVAGAVAVTGGRPRPDLGGYFFEPTVLTNVDEKMRVIQEEIFGPLLPIVAVDSVKEALKLANSSSLGLGASVWTADRKRGEALARQIEAGMVWINDGLYSHICPDAPWGGIKDSGFGTTHGPLAFHDFVFVKHVGVDKPGTRDWNYPYNADRLALFRQGMELCHSPSLLGKIKALLRLIPTWIKTRRRGQ